MRTQQYIDYENEYGASNYEPFDIVISHAEGVWLYDIEGNRYLDCLSAYSAVNQGHIHPRIYQTLIEQAGKLTLTSRALRNDQLPIFYKEISDLTGYESILPMNTGVEAVETAIKLARKWGIMVKGVLENKPEIITFEGNFHGRTITAISFSSEPLYRENFGPYTPGFLTVPYGNIKAVENVITENTVAILIEPIQGEAGVIIPQQGFLKNLRDICDRYNILLIADEIQTGLGRTGKLFACDHEKVRPDIMIIGKALSGGFYPVSAILTGRNLMNLFKPGTHGSTFGGNPLGISIARTALKVIIDEGLIENAEKNGEYLLEHLAEINSPYIKEVRGKGLLIGVELVPEAGSARRFCEMLLKKGILAKDTHQQTIRFAPPLIIDKFTLDWAIPLIRETLQVVI